MAMPIFYHGTTRKRWEGEGGQDMPLYLSTSHADASNYAFEAAAAEEEDGANDFEAILVVFLPGWLESMVDTGRVALEPDWGWVTGLESDAKNRGVAFIEPTWQQSLDGCHGICVSGFSDDMKRGLAVLSASDSLPVLESAKDVRTASRPGM